MIVAGEYFSVLVLKELLIVAFSTNCVFVSPQVLQSI